jgi:hypothetical protein
VPLTYRPELSFSAHLCPSFWRPSPDSDRAMSRDTRSCNVVLAPARVSGQR